MKTMDEKIDAVLRRRRIAQRRGNVSVEAFLRDARWRETRPGHLPDGISIRRVENLEDIPQGRTDFLQGGAGAHTTVATLPIDYREGRRRK